MICPDICRYNTNQHSFISEHPKVNIRFFCHARQMAEFSPPGKEPKFGLRLHPPDMALNLAFSYSGDRLGDGV